MNKPSDDPVLASVSNQVRELDGDPAGPWWLVAVLVRAMVALPGRVAAGDVTRRAMIA